MSRLLLTLDTATVRYWLKVLLPTHSFHIYLFLRNSYKINYFIDYYYNLQAYLSHLILYYNYNFYKLFYKI